MTDQTIDMMRPDLFHEVFCEPLSPAVDRKAQSVLARKIQREFPSAEHSAEALARYLEYLQMLGLDHRITDEAIAGWESSRWAKSSR